MVLDLLVVFGEEILRIPLAVNVTPSLIMFCFRPVRGGRQAGRLVWM